MPSGTGEYKPYLAVDTEALKLLSDYTGMSFSECMELDCYTYKILFKDAFVYHLKQSESGKQYLEDCYLLLQTEPDRETLRRKWGDNHD